MIRADAAVWRTHGGTIVALGPRELRPSLSPCRRDPDKGSRGHHCSVAHAELVRSYRDARDGQQMRAEASALDYGPELASFYGHGDAPAVAGAETKITFKSFLQGSAGRPDDSLDAWVARQSQWRYTDPIAGTAGRKRPKIMTIDYARMQRTHKIHKGRLTRAVNAGDPVKIVKACAAAVAEWDEIGAWPDDWARWNVALHDALHWREALELDDLRDVKRVRPAADDVSTNRVMIVWSNQTRRIVQGRN